MLESLLEIITVPSYAVNKKLKSYSNSSLQFTSMVYTSTKHKRVMCMQQ